MSIKVKLDPTNKILAKRKLQKGGEAQIFFTKQCAKEMNNYVPFLTGRLKDMSVTIGTDYVKYDTPYARKQYYTNSGKGKQGMSHGGRRGARWGTRMWISRGTKILKNVCSFCKVKYKVNK